jgi:uncharacterized protein (TIGR02466 family)|tara:strand:+ start:4427 stop:5014 length:588 start_codon:yes stop_codon:yes gene_type:complete
MINHSVFPTLISEVPNFITDNELKKIKNVIQKNIKNLKHHETFGQNDIFNGNAKSSHENTSNFLDLIPFIKNKIYTATQEYVKQSGFKVSNEIGNSWFNVQKKDSWLDKHTHPSSIISGALFIQTDLKSSRLFFYNPNPMINFTSIDVRNNYNYEWIYFTPKPKTLILFPSWLQHGSNNTLNKSLKRIVVSFNYV